MNFTLDPRRTTYEPLSEWILSRKIEIKSMARHFAGWKRRLFLLDPHKGSLTIRSPDPNGAIVTIPLHSSSIRLDKHFYSTDKYHSLCIKYYDGSVKEVIMKFDQKANYDRWYSALYTIIDQYKSTIQEQSQILVPILEHFIQEQLQIQQIQHTDEDEQATATFFPSSSSSLLHRQGGSSRFSDSNLQQSLNRQPIAVEDSSLDIEGGAVFYDDEEDHLHDDMDFEVADDYDTENPVSTTSDVGYDLHTPLDTNDSKVSKQHPPFLIPPNKPANNQPFRTIRIDRIKQLSTLYVPKMNIVIMAVGTRGDIQPFADLGKRLQQDGHRIRLATHECFRAYVQSRELEFYPLVGDPMILSEFMVKTQGFLVPTSTESILEVPKFHSMIVDIIHSCWNACIEMDAQEKKAFVADVIISNPVTYGHIHCAEALGIPLHLMFPQPWIPTKAFPHPLACLSYQKAWCPENFISYQVVEQTLWLTFERDINKFRTEKLGLQPIRVGQGGWNLLNIHQIPFVKMWSPSLIPKPKDWPEYVDIVGTFIDKEARIDIIQKKKLRAKQKAKEAKQALKQAKKGNPGDTKQQPSHTINTINNAASAAPIHNSSSSTLHSSTDNLLSDAAHSTSEASLLPINNNLNYIPSAELQRFLETGKEPIIFVGFGSMVIKDLESTISLFLEAAAMMKIKLLVQMGWCQISPDRFIQLAKAAEEKGRKVKDVQVAVDLEGSMIFPSSNTKLPPVPPKRHSISESNPSTLLAASITTSSSSKGSVPQHETSSRPRSKSIATESSLRSEGVSMALPSSTASIGSWLLGWGNKLGLAPSSTTTTANINNNNNKSTESFAIDLMDDQEYDILPEFSADTEPIIDYWSAEKHAFFMGPCPHHWLFEHVTAVIHHGGAGTTATGLMHGKATWIIPFFGDQHLWGEIVHRQSVGPKPCSIHQLTLETVLASYEILTRKETLDTVDLLSNAMLQEDGIENAVVSFYQHLPVENMLCDVSLCQGKFELAHIYCQDCQLKMSLVVSNELHYHTHSLHFQDHRIVPCVYTNYALPKPKNATQGFVQGVGGLVHELAEGVADVVTDPVKGMYQEGITGGAHGLFTGLHRLVNHQIRGGTFLYDRVKEGLIALQASRQQQVEQQQVKQLQSKKGTSLGKNVHSLTTLLNLNSKQYQQMLHHLHTTMKEEYNWIQKYQKEKKWIDYVDYTDETLLLRQRRLQIINELTFAAENSNSIDCLMQSFVNMVRPKTGTVKEWSKEAIEEEERKVLIAHRTAQLSGGSGGGNTLPHPVVTKNTLKVSVAGEGASGGGYYAGASIAEEEEEVMVIEDDGFEAMTTSQYPEEQEEEEGVNPNEGLISSLFDTQSVDSQDRIILQSTQNSPIRPQTTTNTNMHMNTSNSLSDNNDQEEEEDREEDSSSSFGQILLSGNDDNDNEEKSRTTKWISSGRVKKGIAIFLQQSSYESDMPIQSLEEDEENEDDEYEGEEGIMGRRRARETRETNVLLHQGEKVISLNCLGYGSGSADSIEHSMTDLHQSQSQEESSEGRERLVWEEMQSPVYLRPHNTSSLQAIGDENTPLMMDESPIMTFEESSPIVSPVTSLMMSPVVTPVQPTRQSVRRTLQEQEEELVEPQQQPQSNEISSFLSSQMQSYHQSQTQTKSQTLSQTQSQTQTQSVQRGVVPQEEKKRLQLHSIPSRPDDGGVFATSPLVTILTPASITTTTATTPSMFHELQQHPQHLQQQQQQGNHLFQSQYRMIKSIMHKTTPPPPSAGHSSSERIPSHTAAAVSSSLPALPPTLTITGTGPGTTTTRTVLQAYTLAKEIITLIHSLHEILQQKKLSPDKKPSSGGLTTAPSAAARTTSYSSRIIRDVEFYQLLQHAIASHAIQTLIAADTLLADLPTKQQEALLHTFMKTIMKNKHYLDYIDLTLFILDTVYEDN